MPFTKRPNISIGGQTNGYWEFLPPGYTSGGSYPLFIYYHGFGSQGDGSSGALEVLKYDGLAGVITAYDGTFPYNAIVICPQYQGYLSGYSIQAHINYLKANYAVDALRVYLSGYSYGGAIIEAFGELGTLTDVAAIISAAGVSTYTTYVGNRLKDANMPLLLHHGTSDYIVPYSRSQGWYDGLVALGASPTPIFNGPSFNADHTIGQTVFDPYYQIPGISKTTFEWALQYSRGGSTPGTLYPTRLNNSSTMYAPASSGGINYSWQQVGSALSITGIIGAKVASLSDTRIVLWDGSSKQLRVYDFNGSSWSLTATRNESLLAGVGLARLTSTTFVLTDENYGRFQAYSISGGTISTLGNWYYDAFSKVNPQLIGLGDNQFAKVDNSANVLVAYSFNGTTTISQLGTEFTGAGGANARIASFTLTRVIVYDNEQGNSGRFRVYDFSGSAWTLFATIQVSTDVRSIAAVTSSRLVVFNDTSDSLSVFDLVGGTLVDQTINLTISGSGLSAVARLGNTRVAWVDDTNDSLRTYDFYVAGGQQPTLSPPLLSSGSIMYSPAVTGGATGWVQIGNELTVSGSKQIISAMSSSRIAMLLPGSQLRVYDFNGTDWTLNASFGVSGTGWGSVAGLDATNFAFVDELSLTIRKYNLSGGAISQVGSSISIPSAVLSPAMAAMGPNRVALCDQSNKQLICYDFNTGTNTWSQVGSALSGPGGFSIRMAPCSSTRIFMTDADTGDLAAYDFNGTTWSKYAYVGVTTCNSAVAKLTESRIAYVNDCTDAVGVWDLSGTVFSDAGITTSISGGNVLYPSITGLGSTRIAYIDGLLDVLRTYDFGGGGSPNAQTLSAPIVSSANNLFFATVTTGAVTTAPPFKDTTNFIFPHTVVPGQVILSAPLFTNSSVLYTHSVLRGAVTISAPRINNVSTLYAGVISVGAFTLTPGLHQNVNTLFQPTVSRGAVTLSIPIISNSVTLFTGVVSTGSITLAPERILSVNNTYTPVINPQGVTLSVSLISDLDNLLQHIVTLQGGPQFAIVPLLQNGNTLTSPSLIWQQTVSAERLTNTNSLYNPSLQVNSVTLGAPFYTNVITAYPIAVVRTEIIVLPRIASTLQVNLPTVFNQTLGGGGFSRRKNIMIMD